MNNSKYSRAAACETANQLAQWLQIRYHGVRVHVFGELVRKGAWHPRGAIRFALGRIHCDPMEIEEAAMKRGLDFAVSFSIFGNPDAGGIGPEDWRMLQDQAVKLPGEILEAGTVLESIALAAELQALPGTLGSIEEANEIADEAVRMSIFATQASHYRRCVLEPLLSKALGMVDWLPFLEDPLEDRLNLYRVASLEIEGHRPCILPPDVAAWHSRHVENHESLLPEAELIVSLREQVRDFQEMDRTTAKALAFFGGFLARRELGLENAEESKR